MPIIDYILLIHTIIVFLASVYFLCWQFFDLSMSEDVMGKWIKVFDILELVVFIITRFINYGQLGRFSLGAFYIINMIILILQIVFAGFGTWQNFKSILWIVYYTCIFMNDVCNVNVIHVLIANSHNLRNVDEFLKSSWLGGVISSIILTLAKVIINNWSELMSGHKNH